MERSEARDILRRWAKIEEEIYKTEQAYKKEWNEIDMIAAIPSPVQNITGMPHVKKVSQTTERVALRRIEIAEAKRDKLDALNNAIIEMMDFKRQVQDCLLLCSPDEEAVVIARYKDGLSMPEAAKKLMLSLRTAWRCEDKVLDTICDTWI